MQRWLARNWFLLKISLVIIWLKPRGKIVSFYAILWHRLNSQIECCILRQQRQLRTSFTHDIKSFTHASKRYLQVDTSISEFSRMGGHTEVTVWACWQTHWRCVCLMNTHSKCSQPHCAVWSYLKITVCRNHLIHFPHVLHVMKLKLNRTSLMLYEFYKITSSFLSWHYVVLWLFSSYPCPYLRFRNHLLTYNSALKL